MYGNPYANPQMNIDRINSQIRELETLKNQYQMPQTPTNLTQNFQLAPTNNTNSGIKYVASDEEVKKELVFNDTVFLNKEYTVLWFKKADGGVKKYKLDEIVEKDEKDVQIDNLKAKIEEMERKLNARTNVEDVIKSNDGKKSYNGKSVKDNDE